jgi:hypothetical protein
MRTYVLATMIGFAIATGGCGGADDPAPEPDPGPTSQTSSGVNKSPSTVPGTGNLGPIDYTKGNGKGPCANCPITGP